MNPCAPSFVPSSRSSDSSPDLSPESTKKHSSPESSTKPSRPESAKQPSRPSRERNRPAQETPSSKHNRNKSSYNAVFDPEKYDTMFPSLQSANPSKDQPAQKAKSVKKKKRKTRAKRVSVHSPEENGGPSKPSGSAAAAAAAEDKEEVQETSEKPEPEPELLKPDVYTPAKPKMELLEPAVYTPPTSSRGPRRDKRVDNFQSPRGRLSRPMGKTLKPRMRPEGPPTPHPDLRHRGRRPPAAGPPVTRVGTPSGLHAPVPLEQNPPFDPGMGPFGPGGPPFPVMCGPSPMPFPIVPWNMMPVPWHPHQPHMPFLADDYGQQSPFWPQPHPGAAQGPQMQGPSRPGSRESSKHSDSLSTPQSVAFRERGGHQASSSLSALRGPASDRAPRTQVEMIKNQERAKSSSPRVPRYPKVASAWMKESPLGKTCQLADTPSDKETPMATAVKTFDKHLREITDSRKSTGFIPTRQVQTSLGSPGVVNGENANGNNGNLVRNQKMSLRQRPRQTDSSLDPQAGPSSRRRTLQPANSTAQPTSTAAGPESGAWSQSKRWTSTATKERQAFQKMTANLRYMGADQSPFVPQTPAELTAFKASFAKDEKRKLAEEVSRRVARAIAKAEEGEAKQLLGELLGGKIFSDHLSPVFGLNNCFNKHLPSNPLMQAEWPPLAEFKEEGDKRAGRQGRCLPLPRLNIIAARYIHRPWEVYNPDGTIRWDKKVVQIGAHLLCAVTQAEASITPPVELQIDTVHDLLKALLGEIHGVETKEENEEDEDENSAEQGNLGKEESRET
ncbi:hypothetical protein ACHAPT_000109 [Fusarium lateritium]